MRGTFLRLAVGLTIVFSLDCGSVSSDGSGTGGSSGQAGDSGQAGRAGGGTSGGAGSGPAGTSGQGGATGTAGAAGGQAGAGGEGGHPAGGAGGHPLGGAGGAAGHASGGAAGGHAGGGGGATGAGGQGGSAGHGSGGQGGAAGHASGGQGGQSVDSGISCADLASEYAAATPAAEACTPGATNQCQTLMPLTLGICTGCDHYVNDATTLKAIQAQWTAQGCNISTALIACPLAAIACINPGSPGNCIATDSAAPGGVCGAGIPTPL